MPDEVYFSRFLAPYGDATRRGYLRTLLDWLEFCMTARVHVLEARRLHIEQWARALAAGGNSQRTVASKLVPVCGFYRWAHQEGLLPVDVAAYVRRPRQPRRSGLKWLNQQQATTLLAKSVEFGPPGDLLVQLFLLNGLRLGETITARVEHLGEQDGHRTLRLPSRKGGVMDVVALPAPTAALLPAHVAGRERGVLVRSSTGRALRQQDVYRVMNQLGSALEVDFPIRPHMLRATFVTLSLDAGVSARDVMASTGHATTAMVDYYDRAHASIRRNASHTLAGYLVEPSVTPPPASGG